MLQSNTCLIKITAMVRPKLAEVQRGQILTLLDLNLSYGAIIQRFKRVGVIVRKPYLTKLKKTKENHVKKKKKTKHTGRPPLLNSRQKLGLRNRAMNINPSTQKKLGAVNDVRQQIISHNIKQIGLKKVKKPKCHIIPPASVQKRASSAMGL